MERKSQTRTVTLESEKSARKKKRLYQTDLLLEIKKYPKL